MANNRASVDHAVSKRSWTVLAATFMLSLLLALAACSSEHEAGELEPYPPPDPLFFELANADGEVEGWLLGTIHELPEGVLWRTPAIDYAIKEADVLYVEVASLGQGEAIRQTFLELSQNSGLLPVTQRVSPELRDQAEEMVSLSNVSRAHLRSSEDWAAAIILSQVGSTGDPKYGVDRAVIADFGGRPVRGFETAASQLGIFDQLAPEDQRELLEGTIEEWSTSKDNPERLMRAWLAGDATTLEAASIEGIMADPELRAALLVDRNNDWMRQLLPTLAQEPKPLIAVGAAHLVGDDGLVTQLEAQGFTLTRLRAR